LHYYPNGSKRLDLVSLGLQAAGRRPRIEYKPLRHLAYLAIGQDMVVSTYHLALLAATVAVSWLEAPPTSSTTGTLPLAVSAGIRALT